MLKHKKRTSDFWVCGSLPLTFNGVLYGTLNIQQLMIALQDGAASLFWLGKVADSDRVAWEPAILPNRTRF